MWLTCSNKKLSYRRDSARRWSLRRSRSFKVTDVSTNLKSVCDFLLVNDTNLHHILYGFPVIAQQWSSYLLWQGVPLVNALVFVKLCKCRSKSYILLNARFPRLLFCCKQWAYLQPLWCNWPINVCMYLCMYSYVRIFMFAQPRLSRGRNENVSLCSRKHDRF